MAAAFVRCVVSEELGVAPDELTLQHDSYGKPRVSGPGPRVQFNLSHSHGHALCAVTGDLPVGVDIERVDPSLPYEEVAAAGLGPRERAALEAIPEPGRRVAFFALWTRREAYLKGVGTGLVDDLGSVPVPGFGGPPDWCLYELPAPAGYTAALALPDAGARIELSEWSRSATVG